MFFSKKQHQQGNLVLHEIDLNWKKREEKTLPRSESFPCRPAPPWRPRQPFAAPPPFPPGPGRRGEVGRRRLVVHEDYHGRWRGRFRSSRRCCLGRRHFKFEKIFQFAVPNVYLVRVQELFCESKNKWKLTVGNSWVVVGYACITRRIIKAFCGSGGQNWLNKW